MKGVKKMQKMRPLRVIHNLNESPHVCRIGQYEFVFSSEFNLQRFKNSLSMEKRKFQTRCKRMYGLRVVYNALTPFVIYPRIERRGYLVRMVYGNAVQCVYNPASIEIVADVHFLPLDG